MKRSRCPAVKSEAALEYRNQCMKDVRRARATLRGLEKPKDTRTIAAVLEPLNNLWMIINRAGGIACLYSYVHPDAGVRAVAEWCEQEIAKIATDVGLSRPVYDAVTAVDVSEEDTITQRYMKHLIRDFRRAGVDKDPDTQEKIRTIQDELVQVGQEFDRNIREDVRSIKLDSADELVGLPQDYIEAHPPNEYGKITITTRMPDFLPFMIYAKSDSRRLELHKAFRNRGWPKNDAVLKKLLVKRHELVQILSYKTWADYSTETEMAGTASAIQSFINRVTEAASPRAEKDYDELLACLRKESPGATEVGAWQKSYLADQVRLAAYDFDSQLLRPYFPFEQTKKGILNLTSQLFGVTYKRTETKVWHPDVEAYEIWENGQLLGRFYLDMHPRDDKYQHAAAFPVCPGVSGRQIPEVALVCNFPRGDEPMEHAEVETFLHEFGHLLHHILGGRQRWVEISGFEVEGDFVEVPSQLLEEWAWDPEALKVLAKNKAGETIPDEMVTKMRRARGFGKGLHVKQQIFFSAISLAFHNCNPENLDTTKMVKELQKHYDPFAFVEGTHIETGFGHLNGYSACYYSYMWSLAIVKELLSKLKNGSGFSQEAVVRYRKEVLEPGGSKDAVVMIRNFLGRDFSFDTFANWLNAD